MMAQHLKILSVKPSTKIVKTIHKTHDQQSSKDKAPTMNKYKP